MPRIEFRHVTGLALLLVIPTLSPGQPEIAPLPKQVEAKATSSVPPELEKRLRGKQILHFDRTVKKGDMEDRTTLSGGYTTYINCRDTYTYFVEPIPEEWRKGPMSRFTGPQTLIKVFHGLRIVYDEKGRLHRIENYYAGELHGQMVAFDDGVRWYEITYKYGLRDGIARDYTREEKLLVEREFKEEKCVSYRSFKEDGQPDR